MKDRGDAESLHVLEQLKNDNMNIVKETMDNPKNLSQWLYENQGEMRFGSENRLYLVLIDKNDFSASWKLKRNLEVLQPAIFSFLDNFKNKKLSDLKVKFNYHDKPQTFTALADVIFVVK